jgi:hypothetical protein
VHPSVGLALDRVRGRLGVELGRGVKVAAVDCGHGDDLIALALAFPASRFFGFDPRPGAIAVARREARVAGLARRVRFQVAAASDFPGTGYHLVTQLGPGHADLTAIARHVRRTLAPDGCWVLLEPSGDHDRDHARLRRVVFEGGFTRVRCAPATPTEVLIEARP